MKIAWAVTVACRVTYKPLTATDDKNLFEVDAAAVKVENTGTEIPLGDMEGDPDLKFGVVDDRAQERPASRSSSTPSSGTDAQLTTSVRAVATTSATSVAS